MSRCNDGDNTWNTENHTINNVSGPHYRSAYFFRFKLDNVEYEYGFQTYADMKDCLRRLKREGFQDAS